MKHPRTQDDYWYNRVVNAQPKKVYRNCPHCGMRVGIPITRKAKTCFMCNALIYTDKHKNESMRKRYNFYRELRKRGIKVND